MKSIKNNISKKDAIILLKVLYQAGYGNFKYEFINGEDFDYSMTVEEKEELFNLAETISAII